MLRVERKIIEHRWMVFLSIAKGLLIMVVITTLANAGFIQSMAIAICSATITGIFLLLSTIIGSRQTRDGVEDLKVKVESQNEDP